VKTTEQNVKILSGVSGITAEKNDSSLTTLTGTLSETALISHTILGGEVVRNDRFRVVVGGDASGTNGTKTIKLKIGSTVYPISVQASGDELAWHAEVDILFLNSYASQRILVNAQESSGGDSYVSVGGQTEDFVSDVVIQCTGTLGHTGDTIRQFFFSMSRT
jgi:hypothetical protein